jgi:hypothetical protein
MNVSFFRAVLCQPEPDSPETLRNVRRAGRAKSSLNLRKLKVGFSPYLNNNISGLKKCPSMTGGRPGTWEQPQFVIFEFELFNRNLISKFEIVSPALSWRNVEIFAAIDAIAIGRKDYLSADCAVLIVHTILIG